LIEDLGLGKKPNTPRPGGRNKQEGITEMSIKKSLLLSFAVTAIAMSAFASSAMAVDGTIKDTDGTVIPNGTSISLKGWAKFETLGTGIECHVTSTVVSSGSGTTGSVTAFAPITSTCHGFGSIYNGCKVTSDSVLNLPYSATVTSTDVDVTSTNIAINSGLSSCVNTNVTFTNLSFEEGITLKPLKTGVRAVTNTENKLGTTTTAGAGEPIAGVELSGLGFAENNLGELGVEATGELEIEGGARCTYKLA
jgi:hypothetical protein